MVFALAVFELHLPGARSLKDKRRIVKALVERVHNRFRVSIAEVDHHDLHQRAGIGLAVVHRSRREGERLLDEIHRMVDGNPEAVLVSWEPEFMEHGG